MVQVNQRAQALSVMYPDTEAPYSYVCNTFRRLFIVADELSLRLAFHTANEATSLHAAACRVTAA